MRPRVRKGRGLRSWCGLGPFHGQPCTAQPPFFQPLPPESQRPRAWGFPGVPREPSAGPACLLHRGPHPPGRAVPYVCLVWSMLSAATSGRWLLSSACATWRGQFSIPPSRDIQHFTVSRQSWMAGRFTVSPPRHMASILRPKEGCDWDVGPSLPSHSGVQPLLYVSARVPVSVADDRPFVPASPGVLTPPADRGGPCRPDTLVRKPWRSVGGGRGAFRQTPRSEWGVVEESAKQADLAPRARQEAL